MIELIWYVIINGLNSLFPDFKSEWNNKRINIIMETVTLLRNDL